MTIIALVLVAVGQYGFGLAAQADDVYVPGQVLMLPAATASSAVSATVREAGLSVARVDEVTGYWTLTVPPDDTVTAAVERLQRSPSVLAAQPNYIYRIPREWHPPVLATPPPVGLRMVPDDPFYGRQWHFPFVGAEAAWDRERGSRSVVIAVVDTGVAYRDYTKGTTQFARVEDLAGTHFVPGYDFIDDDAFPLDRHGHGTHVCGTIAQTTNNSVGCAGLAHGCAIMPIRVLDERGVGSTSTIAAGVKWAAEHGASVINLSLGAAAVGPLDRQAFDDAAAAGVVLVAAAGNSNQERLDYPARWDNVIAVGAVRYDKTRAPYSNYGDGLDVVAPGGDLDVDQNGDSQPDGVYQNTHYPSSGDSLMDRDKYYYVEGTSQACPHVAATAALLLSKGLGGSPRYQAVLDVLKDTAEDLGAAGYDNHYGWGLVKADSALASLGPTYEVSGRVTYQGVGLEGVAVSVGPRSAITLADGKYTVSGLIAGSYTVTPQAEGRVFTPATRSVTLPPSATGQDFESSAPLSSIRGTVTYGSVGLSGVTVTAGETSTTTGSDGAYTISGLAPGTYTVTPSLAGYIFLPSSREVNAAQSVSGVDFAAVRSFAAALPAGIQMVSVPVIPVDPTTVAADILGPEASELYRYDPTQGRYLRFTGTPVPGHGYFVRFSAAGQAQVTGTEPNGGPIELALPSGYSQVGNPMPATSLTLATLLVREGSTTTPLEQAAAIGAIREFAWVWDVSSQSYRLLHPAVAGAAASVAPWSAFFIEALRPVTLVIPTSASQARTAGLAPQNGCILTVTAETADSPPARVYCGWSGTAAVVADAPSSPTGTDGALELRVQGTAERSGALVVEPLAQSLAFQLRLTAQRARAESTVRLTVDGLRLLPRDLSATMTDRETGRTVNLRHQAALDVLIGPDQPSRTFLLTIERRDAGLSLRIVDSGWLRGIAQVRYELSQPAEVTASVMNAAGRVVARLPARQEPSGLRELTWNGRSERGTAVPSGEYRLLIAATRDTGERATASARVTLGQ